MANAIAAEIVDESFDGVGIVIKQLFPVEADEQVELIYHGLPIRGVVCSVTPPGEPNEARDPMGRAPAAGPSTAAVHGAGPSRTISFSPDCRRPAASSTKRATI